MKITLTVRSCCAVIALFCGLNVSGATFASDTSFNVLFSANDLLLKDEMVDFDHDCDYSVVALETEYGNKTLVECVRMQNFTPLEIADGDNAGQISKVSKKTTAAPKSAKKFYKKALKLCVKEVFPEIRKNPLVDVVVGVVVGFDGIQKKGFENFLEKKILLKPKLWEAGVFAQFGGMKRAAAIMMVGALKTKGIADDDSLDPETKTLLIDKQIAYDLYEMLPIDNLIAQMLVAESVPNEVAKIVGAVVYAAGWQSIEFGEPTLNVHIAYDVCKKLPISMLITWMEGGKGSNKLMAAVTGLVVHEGLCQFIEYFLD